jgi:hypothetical protein
MESLESREMLAATYQLQNLLCYNRLGASWTYGTSVSLETDASAKAKSSGTSKVAVGSKTQTYSNIACDVVKATSSAMTTNSAWFTNSKGTYMAMLNRAASNLSMNVTLSNTRFCTKAMTVNTPYQNTGAFSGTVSVKYQGKTYSGTIKGNATARSRLLGYQSVTVAAGKFAAMKGTYSLDLAGTVSMKISGKTYGGTFYDTESITFFAAPGVGVVNMTDVQSTTVSVVGESVWLKATTASKLKSYSLP